MQLVRIVVDNSLKMFWCCFPDTWLVLTAAQCIQRESKAVAVQVAAGGINKDEIDAHSDHYQYRDVDLANSKINDNYDWYTKQFDTVILELKSPLRFNSNLTVI